MASLETRIRDLATGIGTALKTTRVLLNNNAANLNALNTTVKTNIVAAINELVTSIATKQNSLGFTPIDAATKGVANGVASLDSGGKVPSAQLPAYVDDVLEFANLAAFPGTGETGKIYITLDTNKEYRWSGTIYIELVSSPGTTDAVPEGATNLYFTNGRAIAALATPLGTYDTDYVAVFTTALT
jgi:hypothetical protein